MPEDGGAGNGKASVPVKEERPKSPHRPAAAKWQGETCGSFRSGW